MLQEGREGVPLLSACFEEEKIKVVKVKNTAFIKRFVDDFSIDTGEAEALALALEKKADAVATDDRNAIRACKLLGMEFLTAITVLIRTVEKGLVEKNDGLALLNRLKEIGRYRKAILEDAGKRIKGGQ